MSHTDMQTMKCACGAAASWPEGEHYFDHGLDEWSQNPEDHESSLCPECSKKEHAYWSAYFGRSVSSDYSRAAKEALQADIEANPADWGSKYLGFAP